MNLVKSFCCKYFQEFYEKKWYLLKEKMQLFICQPNKCISDVKNQCHRVKKNISMFHFIHYTQTKMYVCIDITIYIILICIHF